MGVAAIAVIMALQGNGNEQPMSLDQMSVDTSGEARPVTIIKYNDYQCPTCKLVKPWEDQLKAEYGDLVTIEYRHFPLSMHPNAVPASQAAEAARIQGAYDGMNDRLFDGQSIWSASADPQAIFVSYAEDLGLDTTQFVNDMQSEEVQTIIDRELSEGNRRLVTGTPTYFINGQKINAMPGNYSQFRTLVQMFMYQ